MHKTTCTVVTAWSWGLHHLAYVELGVMIINCRVCGQLARNTTLTFDAPLTDALTFAIN